jgi:hypothetical protein
MEFRQELWQAEYRQGVQAAIKEQDGATPRDFGYNLVYYI